MRRKLRVAACAICVRDGQVLLARSPADDGTPERVLPGGGMEHGEDPYDTVRRELLEETGYRVEVTGLLGVSSFRRPLPRRGLRRRVDHHSVRLLYAGRRRRRAGLRGRGARRTWRRGTPWTRWTGRSGCRWWTSGWGCGGSGGSPGEVHDHARACMTMRDVA
ncbi:NUDIX domain-containing protein [Streptomyces sp.]|uniref:NUDIX domain-containing protein n=1 Tax=Streptomyces sp. TaxID=1931 RepID=UPI0039C9F109